MSKNLLDKTTLKSAYLKASQYYQESHRFYHNKKHLDMVLAAYDRIAKLHNVSDYFAILYHDAVYNPMSDTNEEDSAELFRKDFVDTLESCVFERAYHAILGTKHGSSYPVVSEYVHDSDLAILGAPSEIYKTYTINVRKEYFFVDDKTWNKGRMKALEAFNKKKIFLSEEFQFLEKQAKTNITEEIERCQNNLNTLPH